MYGGMLLKKRIIIAAVIVLALGGAFFFAEQPPETVRENSFSESSADEVSEILEESVISEISEISVHYGYKLSFCALLRSKYCAAPIFTAKRICDVAGYFETALL